MGGEWFKKSLRDKTLGDEDLRRILENKNIGEYYICSLKVTFEKEKTRSNFFFHPDDVFRLLKTISLLYFAFFFFPLCCLVY